MKETTAGDESIVVECDLPDPPEKVWRALTEQDLLAAWLMPNDLRPEVGARFSFRPGDGEGGGVPIACEILEAEPNRTLRWRQSEPADAGARGGYIESVVSVELVGRPEGGTHLRVVHSDFEVKAPAIVCAAVARLGGKARVRLAPCDSSSVHVATPVPLLMAA
jgi:uncharacterized protein YndB with AHSA1/START domain